MPSLTIADDVFKRLTKRAAALNVTVEQLIAPLLELAAETASPGHYALGPTQALTDLKQNFDAWLAEVQTRARRYPPGFVMDDSRESIYHGCGE